MPVPDHASAAWRTTEASPQPLAGALLLEVWEQAAAEAPLERAISLVSAGWPRSARSEIGAMNVAERDARLLRLRAATFGPELALFCSCPTCAEQMELTAPIDRLMSMLGAAPVERRSQHDVYALRVRLANTGDLAAALATDAPAAARHVLLSRCLEATDPAGTLLTLDALPMVVREQAEAVAEALHEAAEIQLDFVCIACGARHAIALDVAQVLWREVRHAARRLLAEVHDLAWAYGWAEQAILAMSARRRHAYLAQVWQ